MAPPALQHQPVSSSCLQGKEFPSAGEHQALLSARSEAFGCPGRCPGSHEVTPCGQGTKSLILQWATSPPCPRSCQDSGIGKKRLSSRL